MKKLILVYALLATLAVTLSSCSGNYTLFDTAWEFNRALVELPGGQVIEVQVARWTDSEGEQITIEAVDGTIYLVSANNCTMIKD